MITPRSTSSYVPLQVFSGFTSSKTGTSQSLVVGGPDTYVSGWVERLRVTSSQKYIELEVVVGGKSLQSPTLTLKVGRVVNQKDH